MFSPLLEGDQALASMLKLSGCYVGFLLLLFDCVHTKDFRKHSQTQNNVGYVELSHNRYMKELAM